jgi:glycosyltransferase involved in cell wall biosynthesis
MRIGVLPSHVDTAALRPADTRDVRRLACYGWVGEQAGSVTSAGYVALAELTRRGVHVDFFAHRDYTPEPEGLRGENFTYHGFKQPSWINIIDRLPGAAETAARRILYPLTSAAWRRILEPAAAAEHRRSPYDALLVLGTPPVFSVPGVPLVTWLQSPFHTELEAIRRLRGQVVVATGWPLYVAITTWYRYNELVLRHNPVRSDRLILPSEWSRRAMLDRERSLPRVHAVPYPIDLEAFRPDPEVEIDWDRPVVLSLGRIDPRKRIDLLLDAFPIVREAVPGARLLVIGRPGNFPNQLSVLERSPEVEYRTAIPRTEVPALLREAAVVVQPSENENFGSTVAEALACGTPVVVGSSNGTADYVDVHSAVFDSYTPISVARAIIETLRRRRKRPEEVGATARQSAERWFSAERIADQLLAAVAAAISDHRAERSR